MKYFILLFFCSLEIFILSFTSFSPSSPELEKKNISIDAILADSSMDRVILENFFHNIISNDIAGYVLYGSKPVYLSNTCDETDQCIGTEQHKQTSESLEALSIWNYLDLGKHQTNYFLRISDNSKINNTLENEFLLINRDALLKSINDNLILFKYKFGLNVCAESLFNKILDKKENLSDLFKGKTTLLGIILGYGTKNSMAYERGTQIIKSQLPQTKTIPLYRRDLPPENKNEVIKKCYASDVEPGFEYISVKDEIEDLSNSMAYDIDEPPENSTKIAFSYLKGSQESQDLINMYRKAQLKVEDVLCSQNFLEQILNKFNIKLGKSTRNPDSFLGEKLTETLPNLVAKSILEHFSAIDFTYENADYLNCFISGMRDAEKLNSDPQSVLKIYDSVNFFDSYQLQLSYSPQTKNERSLSKEFFKKISSQPDIKCIEPFKLYYKITKAGDPDKEVVNNKTKKVTINYTIKDIEGNFLSGSYKLAPVQTFEISKLIAGLAHGINGMKKNEIRDIFIHQDFAYGSEYGNPSNFCSGKALCVQIELIDIEFDSEDIKLPELVPLDLLHHLNNKNISKTQLEILKKNYMTFCGFRTWLHYKKANQYLTIEDVLNKIHKICSNDHLRSPLDKFERKVLRRFNLFLYYSEPPSNFLKMTIL